MFVVQPFEQMKVDFSTKLREVVLRRHDVSAVSELPSPRREQVQFLEIVIGQLNVYVPEGTELPDKVKANILTGLMFILCDEISNDYKYTDPTNSTLFKVLKEVMNPNEEKNPMDNLACRRLMEVAERFLVHLLYPDGKLGKDLRKENVFMKVQGFTAEDGYSRLKDFYKRLLQIKFFASTAYWEDSIDKLSSQTKKVDDEKSSFLGSLMFWRSTVPEASSQATVAEESQKKAPVEPTARVGSNSTVTLNMSNTSHA